MARRGGARNAVGARDDVVEWRCVRDVLCCWVLGSNASHSRITCLASFGEGVVAAVEVLAFLEDNQLLLSKIDRRRVVLP